jgi:hypothetical protein
VTLELTFMATYQESNLAWQLQQLGQNVGEWLQWQGQRFWGRVPNVEIPEIENWQWWEHLIFHGLLWLGIGLAIAVLWWNRKTWQRYWANLNDLELRPSLPVNEPGVGHWRKLAQQAAQRGDYYQACRHLYLALLRLLQEQKLVEQNPALTDQEYQQLLANLSQSETETYERVFSIHQQLCFGQQPASLELFHHCQAAIAAIEAKPPKRMAEKS